MKNIAISENGFVFNPAKGESFSTNAIGGDILNMIREGKTKDEIRDEILEIYHTDAATFEKDFYDFCRMLVQFKLMEE